MTWNRTAGSRTEVCIRCGERPPATQKRRCKQCLAEMEADRRVRLNDEGDGRPCAIDGCDKPRYRIPSQYSSYCHEHHLASRKKSRLKWQYGLSTEQHQELMASANGACQICGSTDRLVVDHCHGTGVVRGILCDDCNLGLGRFHDEPRRLLGAIGYLALAARRDCDSPARASTLDQAVGSGTGRTTA